ncbi:MAG: YfcE family phosphodiesterase [Arcobacteraceae bacterium]
MKIGILSDSHLKIQYTQECIEFLKSLEAQYLIHAGDLCHEDNLKALKNSSLPYVAVFGNNDNHLLSYSQTYNIYKEPYYFKIKEVSFKLMHLPMYLNGDTDVVIFGHTHIFEADYKNETLFLNPGEICAREKPQIECVLLEITPKEYIIQYYFKNINDKSFTKKEIRYERK